MIFKIVVCKGGVTVFKRKSIFFLMIAVLLLTVSACAKVNPAEDIYNHLEKAVSLEAVFEAQQVPLSQAENEEYDLYDEILKLSDLDEISKLVTKAEDLAFSRKGMIEKERESIQEAYDEFLHIKPIVETLENKDLLQVANDLIATMENRFETYNKLYTEYKAAIDLDLELYTLVLKEDLTIEELEAQHDKVNDSYSKVNDLKDKFNEYTLSYNDLKRDFYKLGDLNVVYN